MSEASKTPLPGTGISQPNPPPSDPKKISETAAPPSPPQPKITPVHELVTNDHVVAAINPISREIKIVRDMINPNMEPGQAAKCRQRLDVLTKQLDSLCVDKENPFPKFAPIV